MLKKIDRYLLTRFFQALMVVIVAIGMTIIIINMVEELRDFIDHEVPLVTIIEYYFYFGGWVVKSFFPVFMLLATLFSVSILARKNEILAMKASGLSLYRIAAPFLIISLLLSIGHFYYSEYLFPSANARRLEIKKYTIERKSRRGLTKVNNVYRQINPGYFYTIATFNIPRAEGQDIKIYKTNGSRLSQIITAPTVTYENHTWIAKSGVVRSFDETGDARYTEFERMELTDITVTPEDFAQRLGKPEDMGLRELLRYIDLMKRTGGPYIRELVDAKLKYSYPLTTFIVVLISIPYAANPRRGGIAVSFAVGALIALVYFVLFRIMQSAGHNEKVPEYVAVWGINTVFFLIGLVSLIKARK